MGYCPFEHWLGRAQGARHGIGAGARAARAQACGECGGGRSARGERGRQAGARRAPAARLFAGPAGCALGARSLFLALFDSVFFQSHIFGHCS